MCHRMIAPLLSFLVWTGSIVFVVLANSQTMFSKRFNIVVFGNNSREIYRKWNTGLTPAEWTFGIWEFIFSWNSLWVLYCLYNACKPNKGNNLNRASMQTLEIFPPRFHIMWIITSVTFVCWMVLWSRTAFVASLFMQGFTISSSIVTLGMSHATSHNFGALLQYKHPWDLWVARTLVQNGVPVMTVWQIHLFCINAVILVNANVGLQMQQASVLILIAFGIFVVVWAVLEQCCFDRWLRYSFSFYPAVLWCVVGVAVKNFIFSSPIFITCLVIGCFTFLALIFRVPLIVWRSFTNPLYIDQVFPNNINNLWQKKEHFTTAL